MKQSPNCILVKTASTSDAAILSKAKARQSRFIRLWPVCAQTRVSLYDEIQYFDIIFLLLYFFSFIFSHFRRVLPEKNKKKVKVVI